MLDASKGLAPGDPVKMVTKMIESVKIEPAPLRMVLGSQALRATIERLLITRHRLNWPHLSILLQNENFYNEKKQATLVVCVSRGSSLWSCIYRTSWFVQCKKSSNRPAA